MTDKRAATLSRRERQIMDVIYAKGSATAAEVLEALPDAPSYSAVRTLLRILEDKGHLSHVVDGPRYVYSPVVPRANARDTALRSLLRTFFDGSPSDAVAALLDLSGNKLSKDELDDIAALVRRARKEGR